MNYLKEVYLTLFVVFYRVFANAWTPGINAWKGVGGVTVLEALVIISASSSLNLSLGAQAVEGIEKWMIVLGTVALFFANYFVLIARSHGLRFEREFADLDRSKKTALIATTAVVLIAILAAFIVSGVAHRRMVMTGI